MDFEAVLEQLSDAVVVASSDNTVLFANAAVTDLLGWPVDEIIGKPIVNLMPERLRLRHQRGFEHYQGTRERRMFGRSVPMAALRVDGTEVEIDITLSEIEVPLAAFDQTVDGALVVATMRDAGERVGDRRTSVERYLRATLEATATLQTVDHPDEAMTALLDALCEQLDWDVAVIWKQDEFGRLNAVDVWHAPDTPAEAIDAMTRRLTLGSGEGLPGKVLSTGGPRVVPDVRASERFLRVEASREAGLITGVGFPLVADEEILGVIEFFSRRPRVVDEELTATLAAIGRQLGAYLARVNSQAALRELAGTLQEALLPPTLPPITGLELAALYRPGAEEASVGGDIYDVFRLGPDDWALLIADVCGKGADAAAVTALARHTVRATALDNPSPSHVIASLNRALLDGGDRPFLTAVYVVLHREPVVGVPKELRRWTAEIACAGHPLPVLVRDGVPRFVGRPGVLVGVVRDSAVDPVTLDLEPGDALVLYTDGVTEARSARRDTFGDDRLLSALAAPGSDSGGGLAGGAFAGSVREGAAAGENVHAVRTVDRLSGAVAEFARPGAGGDDVAILAVAVPPRPAG